MSMMKSIPEEIAPTRTERIGTLVVVAHLCGCCASCTTRGIAIGLPFTAFRRRAAASPVRWLPEANPGANYSPVGSGPRQVQVRVREVGEAVGRQPSGELSVWDCGSRRGSFGDVGEGDRPRPHL